MVYIAGPPKGQPLGLLLGWQLLVLQMLEASGLSPHCGDKMLLEANFQIHSSY